jgi:hypothetical protein
MKNERVRICEAFLVPLRRSMAMLRSSMAILDPICQHGRVCGVISHTPDLASKQAAA